MKTKNSHFHTRDLGQCFTVPNKTELDVLAQTYPNILTANQVEKQYIKIRNRENKFREEISFKEFKI